MLKIRELMETDYWYSEGEKDFKSRSHFEDNFLDDFDDCDYLFLEGEREVYNSIWIMRFGNELIYHNPSDDNYDFELVEEILEDFYLNDKPVDNGFIECVYNNEELPLLKYRGGEGYSYTFWQYDR